MGNLIIDLSSETTIRLTRSFRAPPDLVYRAHVEPDLIRQWMTGPEGSIMPECRFDDRPGGELFMRWTEPDGYTFHVTGEVLEVERGRRLLHVERMFLPDRTPDNRVETRFQPEGTGTRMVVVMTLPDAATRAQMLATGMTDGMEESYVRLEGLFGGAHG